MIGKRDKREPSLSSELEHGISRLKKLNLGSEPISGRANGDGGGGGRMVSGRREKLIVELHTGTDEKNVEIVVKGMSIKNKETKKVKEEEEDVKKKREMKEEKREKSPSPVPTILTLLAPAMATIVEIEDNDDEVTSASSSSREVQKLKFSKLHIC